MSLLEDRRLAVDYGRWPALRRPHPATMRAAAARALMRRVADRTGIRVVAPGAVEFGPADGPVLQIRDSDAFFTRLGRDGKVGFGEGFMAGDWDSPDLVAVLERLARHVATIVPAPLQRLRRLYDATFPRDEDNDRTGARHNIGRHYDLSNDLFRLFLDETMTYSSALFADSSEDEPLSAAQGRKIDRLLDLTHVGTGSTVLEIGTGWGELALRAARRGARVVTLTLSDEQARLARQRVREAGLAEQVDVRVQDYRDADGKYDAVLSVEMIEAVGEAWWPAYFRVLDERLAPGGRVGLQAILLPHDRLMASRKSWTWIHKYIFPGGLIPSLRAIEENVAVYTSLRVVDRLHFGSSYAETLRRWRARFDANVAEVDALGFDAVFRRMWDFYLAYCEAGFRARYLDVAQLTLAHS